MNRTKVVVVTACLVMLMSVPRILAGDIELPQPCMKCGKPFMQVLMDRKSTREYSPKKLPLLRVASVLWAAFGINRKDSGKRTAPSAMNWQETEIYAVMQEGAYRYDAAAHRLIQVLDRDIRKQTGMQPFVKDVPLNLVYVADLSKMGKGKEADKLRYASMDTGFIAQNVYLYCASADMATVVRGLFDQEKLGKLLKLRPEQRITLTQSVGYPK